MMNCVRFVVLITVDIHLHLDCDEGSEEQKIVEKCARLETTSPRVRVLYISASSLSINHSPAADSFILSFLVCAYK
jgi:hypothetical protein